MLVTCCICGKKIEKESAYRAKVIVNKKTGEKELKYKNCCSEQEWQAEEYRKKKYKEDKDKVYYLICDMFGYEIQHTKFFDEWALWNKLQSNEIIYKYIRENEDRLQQICDKQFDSEYHKIKYFSAVLKNSLRDFKPNNTTKVEVEEKPKVVVEEHYETKYKAKGRQALEDLEEDDGDE